MLSEQEEKEKLEAEAKVKTEADVTQKAEWDKTRQRADQEAANAKRAREELSETQTVLETAQSENESLKEQLEKAETKAAEAGITDVELDESQFEVGTDRVLVKAIKSLKQELVLNKKETEGLKKKAVGYEENARKERIQLEANSAYEELLTGLDSDYGADCRNAAVQKFNEMCKNGEVPKRDNVKATRAMEKCYKEVKAAKSKDTTKEKSSFPLDSGSGGGSPPSLSGSELKSGSLEEVAAQYAAATKS